MEWLEESKIPVGKSAAGVVDWMIDNLDWFFDNLALVLEFVIDNILLVLQYPPPLLVIACCTGVLHPGQSGTRLRSYGVTPPTS